MPVPKQNRPRRGDQTPVSGGCSLPAKLRRQTPPIDPVPTDDITLHITRLLALHPNVSLRFRSTDLAALDTDTKQILLDDINRILKISRFRKADM